MGGQGGIGLRAVAVGGGYAALAFLCLETSRFGAPVESVWLPNALLVAALIATPRAGWGMVVAFAAVGHVSAHLATGDRLDFSLAFLLGDMSEGALCAFLLAPRTMAFETRKDIFRFLTVCGLIGPSISALIAAAGTWLIHRELAPQDVAMWFSADSLGLLFFLPLAHGFGRGRMRKLARKPIRLTLAVLLVVGFSLVGAWLNHIPTLRLLLLPLFVGIAFELGVAGAEICLAALMIVWTAATFFGRSPVPWIELSMRDYMLVTQVFLAVFSATILPLAVALEEKQRLNETLASCLAETRDAWGGIIAAEARYRLVVDNVSETVMRVAPDGVILFASDGCAKLLHAARFEGRNLFDLMHPDDAAREREHFGHCVSNDLLNLPNRWAWRIQGDDTVWTSIEARVTLVAPGGPGEKEFVVVLGLSNA